MDEAKWFSREKRITEEEFAACIKIICRRPKMYTPTGSFFEAMGWLDGFGVGAGIQHGHHAFSPFIEWMRIKYYPDKLRIDWADIRDHFGADEEALMRFPLLYREFLDNLESV